MQLFKWVDHSSQVIVRGVGDWMLAHIPAIEASRQSIWDYWLPKAMNGTGVELEVE